MPKGFFYLILLLSFTVSLGEAAGFNEPDLKTPGALLFTPPEGWEAAGPEELPFTIHWMVVGKGLSSYPPSINLGIEPYQGTLKEYLKLVKAINLAQGTPWRDLGTMRTQAGSGSLSQADIETEWGTVRLMHLIFLRSGRIYIVTAAALKEEFARFYSLFFQAMKSVRFNPD